MNNGQFKHFAILSVTAVVLTLGALQVGGSWTDNVSSSVNTLANIAPAAGEDAMSIESKKKGMMKEKVKAKKTMAGKATIGADFSLTDQNGETITDETLHGKHSLIFFGFTACPDVCPAGLNKMKAALDMVGEDAGKVTPVFITIDPDRDTPETLKAYLAQYDENFVGITGEYDDLKAVQDGYKVYASRVDDDEKGTYLMNHSAYVYLMNEKGEFVTVFSSKDTPEVMAKKIKEALSKSQQG